MLLYPLAYAVIWSLPTAIRIYQATKDKPAAFTLQTIDKTSIVIQGLVDSIIYGINETTRASWRARFPHRGYPTFPGAIVHGADNRQTNMGRERSPQLRERRSLDPATSSSNEEVGFEIDDASSLAELRELRV